METKKHGSLTKRQFLVLKYRTSGLSQLQTARKLTTSRANISMIELRAKKKIEKARETLWAYESMLSKRVVRVKQGTRLQEIPSIVLAEGDRSKIHLRSNLVEIIRMVKRVDPACVKNGEITRDLEFAFTQSGLLTLA
ncbi:MAG: Tfx family DNA-binding protein [archaeon]|nr:Tfx family DNA-binding protein [archaeon]